MKKARVILASAMIALMGVSALTLSSCSKDEKVCDPGYEGKNCKDLSRDKFIGKWNGTEECSIGADEYTIQISTSSESEVKIVYENVYNDNYTATGTMTGPNGFKFSGSASGGVTFDGTASLDPGTNVLTVDYRVLTSGVETNTCKFKGTKL